MSLDQKQSFVLNGHRYNFSRSEVLAAVKNQTPRRIDKYEASINGVLFPPKQVLELLTGTAPINFTTMDAQRILKKLGFPTRVAAQTPAGRSPEDDTVSEQVFAHYLQTYGYPFEFEPALPQTKKRPDFRVTLGDKPSFFEVKEFSFSKEDSARFSSVNGLGVVGGGAYDPYVRIRQKIDDAREKFKGIKDHVCCPVLFNREKPLVDLNWHAVYGAMLGPVSVSIPYDHSLGKFDSSQSSDVFRGGGKCGPNHNTNLSAVLVLEPLLLGERRFCCHFHKLRSEIDRQLSWAELFELERVEREKSLGTERDPGLIQWRVVVHENPWASNPLNRNWFRSRFDERYGDKDHDGHIQPVFIGDAVEELLDLEEQYPSTRQRLMHKQR